MPIILFLWPPHFKKLPVPCAPKILSYGRNSQDIQSGKVRSWHSFTEFCGIEYVAMAFFTLGSLWWNLQPAGFRFWSAHRFGVLRHYTIVHVFPHCEEWGRPDIFSLSWALPVDLTRDKFRLNFWIVKMILWLIFRRQFIYQRALQTSGLS